jgi:hypothetical protein
MDCGSYSFCLNYMSYLDIHIQWHISTSLSNLCSYLWRVMVQRMFYCVEQAISDSYCRLPGCDATVRLGPDYMVSQPRGPQDNIHLYDSLKLCITLWDLRFSQQCGLLLNSGTRWCYRWVCVYWRFEGWWCVLLFRLLNMPRSLKTSRTTYSNDTVSCQNTQVLILPCQLFGEVKEYNQVSYLSNWMHH